jgi:processive 1,2-diacylglycerol beta-glucosyltransferase
MPPLLVMILVIGCVAAARVLEGSSRRQRCKSSPGGDKKGFSMVQLHEKETGVFVGTITDAQLQFLIDQLEEESSDDTDYYIDHATLDLFEEVGIEADLLALLRQALGTREGIEIVWSRA